MRNLSYFVSFFFFFFSVIVHAQQYSIKGTVYCQKTLEPLSFVNITINELNAGGITDIDGRFNLKSVEKPTILKLSYVGYENALYVVDEKLKAHNVYLKPAQVLLNEVLIFPGENPAHRIIDSVLKYRDVNNPEMLSSFSYKSHNKLSFGLDVDRMQKKTAKDSIEQLQMQSVMNKTYLMLIESITERKYLYPGKSKETVLASKVSGLNDPLFSLIASQVQTFSFYSEYISILDNKFLNPISRGSTDRYFFLLEDTLYHGKDTVFIISYRPRRNRNFEGLEGLLYVNTGKYALQHVTAQPAEGNAGSFGIKLRQTYELIDSTHWFPVQLNTELFFDYPQSEMKLFGNGRSYIQDISINGKISKRELDHIEYDILYDAGSKDNAFWEANRFEPLSDKDLETYRLIDSISRVHNLNRFSGLFNTLIEGKIPCKFLNIDIDKLFGFNNYYGWRAGLGLETNRKVSQYFTVGGYAAYSFKKDNFGYGAHASFYLNRKADMTLKCAYINDDIESAASPIQLFDDNLGISDFRSYLIRLTDRTQMYKLTYGFRHFKYWKTALSFEKSTLVPNFNYMFVQSHDNLNLLSNNFVFSEVSLHTRFAYREKFVRSSNYTYSLGTDFPIVIAGLTKGLTGKSLGDFDYWRMDIRLEKDFNIKMIGTSSFKISAGYIDSPLPYSKLYNGLASFENYSVYAPYTFNTMRMNEFVASEYVSLFYAHSFGSLLFSRPKFKPECVIVSGAYFGTQSSMESHRYLSLNTAEKGYFESGLIINDILNTGFYGLGAGAFFRYGAYSLPDTFDNFAFKLAFKLKL